MSAVQPPLPAAQRFDWYSFCRRLRFGRTPETAPLGLVVQPFALPPSLETARVALRLSIWVPHRDLGHLIFVYRDCVAPPDISTDYEAASFISCQAEALFAHELREQLYVNGFRLLDPHA